MIYNPYLTKFRELQNQFQSNTKMFFYLITKFNSQLNQLCNEKSSSKKKYQTKNKQYSNIGIRVSPAIHQALKDISDATSYSISAIVRFFIEWEEGSQGSNKEIGDVVIKKDSASRNHEQEIVITEISFHHRFDIGMQVVQENFNFGFS